MADVQPPELPEEGEPRHSDERFSEEPFQGIHYGPDGEILDPPPGPERDRDVALAAAWQSYWTDGDESALQELGILP